MNKFSLSLAAIALMVSTAFASADSFDTNLLTTSVTTGALEFVATTTVDSDLNNFGDDYLVGAQVTVLSYNLANGTSDVNLYGAVGELAGEGFGVVGAQYAWITAISRDVTLELMADATYVMADNVENGNLLLSPSMEMTVEVTNSLAVFGGAGYTWEATDSFAQLGGYVEVGLDVAVSDTVALRPSVIRPFDTANDNVVGSLELKLNF